MVAATLVKVSTARNRLYDYPLYPKPFRKLLILDAEITDLFFILDLLEKLGEPIW